MISVVFFTLLAIVAMAAAVVLRLPRASRTALMMLSALLFVTGLVIGSSVVIDANKTGVVMKNFGLSLPAGAIIARNGEQGPQARILGPGWHFGYIPVMFEVREVEVALIEHGKLGFITAKDGLPLSDQEIFAPEWKSTTEMLNPETFLSNGGKRGPQSTVLTPGTYRYNPNLHDIKTIASLNVEPGTVAVITARTGELPPAGGVLVNGVPLVPKNCRGIWRDPLPPGAYYLNSQAYSPVLVKTIQRVYTYQQAQGRTASSKAAPGGAGGDWSVTVRSKDGFSFPIDVRVACSVEAGNAPYLVALLGDPDKRVRDEQEDEDLEILEAKVILPAVRAIFRNVTETMNALEFVDRRSFIEQEATTRMKAELLRFHVTCENVYVGQIHLDTSEAGKKLIATQTDREVAVNQQKLYDEQRKAEVSRAAYVKAQEEAEQQRHLAKATYSVQIQEQEAKARAATAKGESDYQTITGEGRAKAYRAMVEALGREQVAQLEILKLVAEGKVQITPQVMVSGGSGVLDALGGTMLRQAIKTEK